MPESLHLMLAVLLPCLVAAALWLRLDGREAGPGRLSCLLGASLLLGMLLAAMLARALLPVAGASVALVGGLALLLIPALLAAGGSARRWLPARALFAPCWPDRPGWPRILAILLLTLLALRGLGLGLELAWRPLFPWDAWSTWALRARYWFLAGEALVFVPIQDWLEQDPGRLRYNPAAHYPQLIPALQLWMASAWGGWHEPVTNLPWGLLWLALGLLVFGQLRALGVPGWLALLACWATLSLPLLNAHVALAGYADLWIATLLCAAVLQLLRWRCEGGRGRLALGLLFAVLLPAVKLEGTLWLVCVLVALALAQLPARLRWPCALLGLLLIGLALAWVRVTLALPGLGELVLDAGRLQIPGLGELRLSWQPVASAVASTLWLAPNWHLLFWVVPVLLVWAWRPLLRPGALFQVTASVLLGTVWLGMLFFLTEAARWAEDFTSFARLTLHLVPLLLCWAVLLFGLQRGLLAADSALAADYRPLPKRAADV